MNQTKPTFTSKTVLTGIAMLIFNVLVLAGWLPEGLTEELIVSVVNSVGAVLAIIFRKSATAELK